MNKTQLERQIVMLTAYIDLNVCGSESHGLCDNVLVGNFPIDLVFKSWMHYKGTIAWVIEGGSWPYYDNERKHDRRTKYGKLRLSLAEHCLEYVMNELKEAV